MVSGVSAPTPPAAHNADAVPCPSFLLCVPAAPCAFIPFYHFPVPAPAVWMPGSFPLLKYRSPAGWSLALHDLAFPNRTSFLLGEIFVQTPFLKRNRASSRNIPFSTHHHCHRQSEARCFGGERAGRQKQDNRFIGG